MQMPRVRENIRIQAHTAASDCDASSGLNTALEHHLDPVLGLATALILPHQGLL